MANAYWEHFPHQADIGVRGVGPTLATAFEQAALAMTAVTTDPVLVAPGEPVEGPQPEIPVREEIDELTREPVGVADHHQLGRLDHRRPGGRRLGVQAFLASNRAR